MGSEWYLDFVNPGYKPSEDDLICVFRVEPAEGISIEEAAGRVASESSVGTWTTLYKLPERIKDLMAQAFEIKGSYVRIAYPLELWEPGNMPQILSGVAGNIFGMKAVENLRLEDIYLPEKLVKSFRGPQLGVAGVRELFGVRDRPLTATVPKPKVGLSVEETAETGYEAWTGGLDLLKDDENLSSQSFNRFERRVAECLRMRDRAEKETGERRSYLINITAETREMLRRARFVRENGGEYVMVDMITAGWSALQTLREECEDLGLAIHAHRAMHSTFTRKKHGVSMLCVAKAARLVGVDQIHTGTVVGKLESPEEEVTGINRFLQGEWFGVKPVLPVASGGLHPGLIPELLRLLGNDIVVQAGGGCHGHPKGTRAGAKAIRQAIEASLSNTPLSEYAESHEELRLALEKWGYVRPR